MAFARNRTDRRFAHFCRTGDPDALGDVFDATAGRLMRVALWLSGDRADAEDLLQRTFLQLIETRAQFRIGEPVLPWMIGLLGNQAHKLRRERERKADARAERERVVDPLVEAAARELDEAILAVQERLGDPYRDVLRLHLQQGLNAKEIAQRLQRPAGTVRTQLVRALEQLRRRLPGGFVAGMAAIAALDVGALAAVRGPVLAAARAAAPTVAAAGGGTGVGLGIGGVLLMKKVLFVSLLVLVLGGLALWSATRSPDPVPEPPVAQQPATNGQPVAPARAAAQPPAAQRRPAPAVAARADATTARLTVTMRWQDDGSPARGIGISGRLRSAGADSVRRAAVTDDHGVAVLDELPPGEWSVDGSFVDGALRESGPETATRSLELAAGDRREVEVTAMRESSVRGVVVDREGARVAGAMIWVSANANWSSGWRAGVSAGDGSFEVPLLGFHYIGARCDGHVPSFTQDRQAQDGPHTSVVLQLRGPAARIDGRVRDGRGQPVAGARVRVGHNGGAVSSTGTPGVRAIAPNPEEHVTDDDGRFVATEIEPGEGPVWVWAPGFGLLRERYSLAAGETHVHEYTLPDGAVVAGVVRDEDGTPIEKAVVRFGDEFRRFPQARAVSDELGRYRLADLPAWPGGTELTLLHDGRTMSERVELQAGGTTEWNPVLPASRTIGGTVLGPDGEGLAGIRVGAVHKAYQQPQRWHETDDAGRFELANVGDEPRTVRVARGETVLADVHRVAPDTADLVVRLDATDLPTATLRGRIVDWRGRGVAGLLSVRRDGSDANASMQLDEHGAFEHGPAPAGRYTLLAFLDEFGTLPLDTVELAPHQELQLDTVQLRVPGSATITAADAAGEVVQSGRVFVRTLRGGQAGSGRVENGRLHLASLQPGRYFAEVSISGRHAPQTLTADFVVASGTDTAVDVRGRPNVQVRMRCIDPEATEPPPTVRFLCRAKGRDEVVAMFATWPQGKEPLGARGRLPVGAYEIEGRSSDGRVARTTLTIAPEDLERRGGLEFEVTLEAR